MRIPERAKPPQGGVRTATDGNRPVAVARLIVASVLPELKGPGVSQVAVMRKAPAPGAEVAAVLSRARKGCGLIIPPTPATPGPRALPKGCS
jgi:hypothetical protein